MEAPLGNETRKSGYGTTLRAVAGEARSKACVVPKSSMACAWCACGLAGHRGVRMLGEREEFGKGSRRL